MLHKHRLLLVTKGTPLSQYRRYQEDMKTTSSIQTQKELNIRRKTTSGSSFSVSLYGYDGKEKKMWTTWPGWNSIRKLVDTMPIRKTELLQQKKNTTNYSLYSDDHPNTTLKGLGFANKQVALHSIKLLQQSTLTTPQKLRIANVMIQRARFHPHTNHNMKEAIGIYKNYITTLIR
jgi:hypothetical protein